MKRLKLLVPILVILLSVVFLSNDSFAVKPPPQPEGVTLEEVLVLIDDLRIELTAYVDTQVANLQTTVNSQIAGLQSALDLLLPRVSQNEADIAAMQAEISELEYRIWLLENIPSGSNP